MATHYEVLGVTPGATHDEIRRAYYRLARRHHPDAHSQASPAIQDAARRTMVGINAAWAVLGDLKGRSRYDAEVTPPPRRAATSAAHPDDGPPMPPGFPNWVEPDDWFDPDEAVPAYRLEEDFDDGVRGPAEQLIVFVPVGLAALAVVTFAFAMVVQWSALLSVSFLLAPLALVSFLAAPFLAMATKVRSRPSPD